MNKKPNITILIQKYLEDKCSQEELHELLQIISEEKYTEQIEFLLYKYWEGKSTFRENLDKDELDELLRSINRKINRDTNEPRKGIIRRLSFYMGKTAAVLIIPLLMATAWLFWKKDFFNEYAKTITMETPAGSKLKTTLPDGTIVWQNNGTILKYPANFSPKNRKVELLGEAYFHVFSDQKHPFYVETAKGTVKVTGTRFSVCTFPEDEFSSIVLEEGKVAFRPKGAKPFVALEPKMQLTINNTTGKMVKQSADIEKHISWMDGKLIFRNDPLDEVINKLKRRYNADILIMDPSGKMARHPLTLTVQNELLPQVLENITHAANLKLEVKNAQLSGIPQKQYIISPN